MRSARAIALVLGLAAAPAIFGCGAGTPARAPAGASPLWLRRTVWVDERAGRKLVFVVGRAPNAALDESSAMDSAAQDARENLALYLKSETHAIRERAGRRVTSKSTGSGQLPSNSASVETHDERAGATVAEAAVSGLEIVDSSIDASTDTQFVLGQLDLERYRVLLGQSEELTAEERDAVSQHWEEVGPRASNESPTATR